tara:strand:- start:341 stop:595 length:255 start_codon:yes stop_codon:yes gene_type:complete
MRPKIRKVNTNKRKKERKDARRQLEKQAAAFLDHPTECSVCKAPFTRTKETVKEWHVVVRSDRVRLACPRCWGLVEERLEQEND